jgi:hypothetical protein
VAGNEVEPDVVLHSRSATDFDDTEDAGFRRQREQDSHRRPIVAAFGCAGDDADLLTGKPAEQIDIVCG